MHRLLLALVLLAPLTSRAQETPPDIQQLMDKARSGQKLTPEEQNRLRMGMMQRSQQQLQHAMGAMPPDIHALMQKAQSGQKLSAEEQQEIRNWAMGHGRSLATEKQGEAAQQRQSIPPDLMQLMMKKHRGEALTPEEEQRLREGMMKRAAERGNPNAAKALEFMANGDAAVPKENASVQLASRPALTRDAYAQLVKQIRSEAATSLGAERASKLDAAARAKPKAAANLGVLLSWSPDGPGASAYALAGLALAHPGDALIASNLGVALYNANFFERAYDVLGYADALHPGSGVILSNRGFAAMYLGDLKTATALFGQAVAAAPLLPDPQTGLALIAKARGDKPAMVAATSKAIAEGSGSFVDQSMQGTAHADESWEQRADDTPIADQGASLGGIVIDLNAKSSLRYPTWTIPARYDVALSYLVDYTSFVSHEKDVLNDLAQRRKALDEQFAAAQQARRPSGTGLYFPRHNPRILVVLDDLAAIYDARAQRVQRRWEKAIDAFVTESQNTLHSLTDQQLAAARACGDNQPCIDRVSYEYCEKFNAQGREFHASVGQVWGETEAQLRELMTTYFKKSDPYVDGIADPTLQRLRQMDREFMFRKRLVGTRDLVPSWLGNEAPFMHGTCVPPPPPPDSKEVASIKDEGDTGSPTPGKCFPPPNHGGLGPVSVSWDCNGFKIEGGEGLFAGVEVKFAGADHKGTLSGHTETTVFAGVGDQLAIGKATGKADAVISFTQAQGQVVDVGAKYETSVSAEGYGSKADLGTEVSWGMRAGPNMSASAEATFAGKSIGNTKL